MAQPILNQLMNRTAKRLQLLPDESLEIKYLFESQAHKSTPLIDRYDKNMKV